MPACNTTLDDAAINETPLWNGGLVFHHLGLIICAVFGLFSVAVSFFLIIQHALHYSKPWEQRHIIRILFMIPIYATVSFLSYLYYRHAIYYEVLRDCYEAFAIASFFYLLCEYVAPTLHEQKDFFRSLQPVNWFCQVFYLQKLTGGKNKGILRIPRSGLTWFNIIWLCVFQYCFIRVFFTIVSVVAQIFGRYCEESNSPAFAKIWVEAFEAVSVSIAMFCLVQFYIQLRKDLAEHRPFLKVLCIKLVIFFTFWQTWVISLLSSSKGPLRATDQIAYTDIKVGIPTMLICIEMAAFSIMHVFAFPWKEYDLSKAASDPLTATGSGFSGSQPRYQGGFLGWKAYLDAFNLWDFVKASARGFRWLFVGRKKRFEDPSYKDVLGAPGGVGGKIGNTFDGPTYTGNNEAATELERRGRADTAGTESDTVGLLSHQAGNSPVRPTHADYDQTDGREDGDISMQAAHGNLSSPMPSAYGGRDSVNLHPQTATQDTAYYSAPMAPSQQPGSQIGIAHGGGSGEWNMWAGAGRQDHDGGESTRPPTYRTNGP